MSFSKVTDFNRLVGATLHYYLANNLGDRCITQDELGTYLEYIDTAVSDKNTHYVPITLIYVVQEELIKCHDYSDVDSGNLTDLDSRYCESDPKCTQVRAAVVWFLLNHADYILDKVVEEMSMQLLYESCFGINFVRAICLKEDFSKLTYRDCFIVRDLSVVYFPKFYRLLSVMYKELSKPVFYLDKKEFLKRLEYYV